MESIAGNDLGSWDPRGSYICWISRGATSRLLEARYAVALATGGHLPFLSSSRRSSYLPRRERQHPAGLKTRKTGLEIESSR